MAKFTDQQIKSFNDFQNSGVFHPFTCGSGRRTDEHHLDGEGLLVLTPDGLRCPYCEYTQDWAHEWMLNDGWRNTQINCPDIFGIPSKEWLKDFMTSEHNPNGNI